MKVNIDITKTDSNNAISDELLQNVGASAFNLEHDFFYGSTDLEIWTAAGQSGTQLVEDTDYTLGGIDSGLTTRAGVNIYSTVTVINVTYQTGNLYFTYHACADFVDAFDRYEVTRKTDRYIKLYSDSDGGGFDLKDDDGPRIQGGTAGASSGLLMEAGTDRNLWIRTTGTTGGAIDIWSGYTGTAAEGIDIHADSTAAEGMTIRTTSSAANGGLTVSSASSLATALKLNAPNGGIDIDAGAAITMDAIDGITISNPTTGTGTGLKISSDAYSEGSVGSNITIETIATTGTPGNIIINSADTAADAIDIDSAGGIDIDADGDIDIRDNEGAYITITAGNFYTAGIAAGSWQSIGGDVLLRQNNAGSGILELRTARTTSQALYLNASAGGGIDVDSQLGVNITDQYVGAATGLGIDIISDVNNASGTSGGINIQTIATDGTPGGIVIDSADTAADAIRLNTTGGIDIDTDEGLAIDDDSGGYIRLLSTGQINLSAANSQTISIVGGGVAGSTTISGGRVRLTGQSSGLTDSIDLDASGGIEINSATGTSIIDQYILAATGGGVTIQSDVNNASGTAGDITLENLATSGTGGEILLKPTTKIEVYGDIMPDTTTSHDIGSTSLKFDNIWAATGHFDASTIFLGDDTVLKVTGGKFQLATDGINFQTFATQAGFRLLIYYGSPQGINALWDNDLAAQELSFWDYIILGEGLQDSGHADYANNTAIVTKLKAIRPDIKIFGYIDIGVTTNNDSIATMQGYADDWVTFGAHGVFYDNAGYDFQVPRTRQNSMIDYAHNNDMLCFINAWDPDDVFETAVEATYNPTGIASTASAGDYYLAESWVVNTNAYSANSGYAQQADTVNKGNKIIGYANTMGIISMANGIIQNADTTEERLAYWDTFQVFALIFGMKGYGIMPYQYSSAAPMADVGLKFDFVSWADEFYTDTVEYYLDGSWETFRREQNGHNVTGYIKNTTGPYYGIIDGIATRLYADLLPYRDAQIDIGHADFNFANIYVSNILDTYDGTGTGTGVTVTVDVNNASGTGGDITLETTATSGTGGNIAIASVGNLTFNDQYMAAAVALSETGETVLDTTAQSIIGAINEVNAASGGGGSLDAAYDLGSAITVDDTNVVWTLSAAKTFEVVDATDTAKFVITNGTGADSIKIDTSGGIDIDTDGGFLIDDDSNAEFYIMSNGYINIRAGTGQDAALVAGDGQAYFSAEAGHQARVYCGWTTLDAFEVQVTSGGVDINAGLGVTIDDLYTGAATGNGITLTADVNNASGTSGPLTLQTLATDGTGANIVLNSIGNVDIDTDAGFFVNDDSGSFIEMAAVGYIDIKSGGTQQAIFGASGSGGVTIFSQSGVVQIQSQDSTSAGAVDLIAPDGGITIRGSQSTGTGNVAISSGGGDVTFQDTYLSAALPISESGETALDGGFTAISIVGALNELKGAGGGGSLDDSYNLGSAIAVDDTNVVWTLSATKSFQVIDATDTSKFVITAGTGADSIKMATTGGIDIDVNDGINIADNSGAYMRILTAGDVELQTAAGRDLYLTGYGGGDAIIQGTNVQMGDTGGSDVDAIRIFSTNGGIDIDADIGIDILSQYGSTGTANGISIKSDVNNASGTAGPITLQTLATSGTGAGIVINSVTDIDIDTADGIAIDDDSGAQISISDTGKILARAASGADIELLNQGGYLWLRATSGQILIDADATAANAVRIDTNGGIDSDTKVGTVLTDTYSGGSTGTGITIETDNTSTGTGGDLTLQTTDTGASGATGNIVLTSGGTGTAAMDINTPNGGIDIDVDSKFRVDHEGGGYLDMYDASTGTAIDIVATYSNLTLAATANTSIWIQSTAGASDNIFIQNNNGTELNAIELSADAGGVDIDTGLGTTIDDTYASTGTGNGITLTADVNNASGTGGDITLQTTATSGTGGNIALVSVGNLTFNDQYTSSPIALSETGEATLDTTSQSLVGAINEVHGELGAGAGSLDDAYDNGSAVTVDSTDVDWVLSASRDFRIYDATDADKFVITNGAGADSIKIDTTGGVDIDVDNGFRVDDDGGGYIELSSSSSIGITSPAGIQMNTSGAGSHINISATGAGNALLQSANTGTLAVRLNASAGGIDADSVLGTVITDTYAGAGSGTGLTAETVNTGTGTGGDLTIETSNTNASGTAGDIVIQSIGGVGASGKITIATQDGTAAALDINLTDGGLDADVSANIDFNSSTGNIILNAGDGSVDIDAGNGTITADATSHIQITSSAGNVSFNDQYLSAAINISETGETALDGGFTATSIVGALNELKTTGPGSADLDDAYNNGSAVTVDTTDVDWNLSASRDFRIYDSGDSGKFVITAGTGATSVSVNTSGGMDLRSTDGATYSTVLVATSSNISLQGNYADTSGTGPNVVLNTNAGASGGTGGDIQLSTTDTGGGTAGNISIDSKGTLDLDSDGGLTIDDDSGAFVHISAAGEVDIAPAAGQSGYLRESAWDNYFEVADGYVSMYYSAGTAANGVDIGSSGGIDIDATGVIDMLAGGATSTTGRIIMQGNSTNVAAFNLTANNGGFALSTGGVTGTGDIVITSNYKQTSTGAGITLTSDVDNASGTGGDITLQTTATSGTGGNIAIASVGSLTFDDQYTSSAIALSETGEATLDTTSQSLVGAINEVHGELGGSVSLDGAYNNGSSIAVDTTDVDWLLSSSRDFRIYDAGNPNKFVVTEGSAADSVKIETDGGLDIDTEAGFNITEITGSVIIQGTAAGQLYMQSGGTGTITLNATESTFKDNYGGGGTGVGLVIETDNTSTGTGGDIDIRTTDSGASGTPGNIDIVSNGYAAMYGGGTGGGYVYIYDTGEVTIGSDTSQSLTLSSSGGAMAISGEGGNITVSTNSTGRVILQSSASTAVDAIELTASTGGIEMNAADGIDLKVSTADNSKWLDIFHEFTNTSGGGGQVYIRSDATQAGGTGANVNLVTQGTGGTAGRIILNSGSTASNAINLTTTGGIDIQATGTTDPFEVYSLGGVDIHGRGAGSNPIQIREHYNGSGTGQGIDIASDNEIDATGTGGTVDIRTTGNTGSTGGDVQLTTLAGGGTAGGIVINSAATDAAAIDIDSSGGIDIDAAGLINLTTTATGITLETAASLGGTIYLHAPYSGGGATGWINLYQDNSGTGTCDGIDIVTDNSNASGTGGSIDIRTVQSSGTAGKILVESQSTAADAIKLDTTGGIDIDTDVGFAVNDDSGSLFTIASSGQINLQSASGQGLELYCQGTSVATMGLYSLGGIELINYYSSGSGQQHPLKVQTENDTAGGTGGDIEIETLASAGTAGAISLQTTSVERVRIKADGDTIFYGTAATDGALPVITLDQADVDEPFLKFIGDAASADLTRNIVDDGDVAGGETLIGWIKVEILDDGDQVTDGDYFIPFYTLA